MSKGIEALKRIKLVYESTDNDLICFEIRGLLDKETWSKIYEVLGVPIL